MSPKLSSLAVEDIEYSHHETMNTEPELYVVEPRHLARSVLASITNLEEVIFVGGQFTVSF